MLGPTLIVALAAAVVFLLARQRRQVEARGREARRERALATLAAHADEVLLLVDGQDRIAEANDRAVATYGWPREALVGRPVRELREPSMQARFEDDWRSVREGGAHVFETVHRRHDGATFPVEVSLGRAELEGAPVVIAVVRDLSERRRAEAARRVSEARFQAAFHGAGVGMALVDARGRLLDANDALCRMLGYPREELAALTFQDLLHPDDREGSLEAFGALVRGEREHNAMERRYLRKDGGVVHLRYSVSALRDDAGRFVHALGIIEDVTERKALEARLALADRMASLGTLAAGVAHEINNPLSYVIGNLAFVREALAAGAATPPEALTQARQALDEANEGAARVRQIVGDLRALSRSGEDRHEPVDVGAAVRSAANVAAGVLRPCAALRLELGPTPPVLGDPARLGQVFLNLLVNAGQAIGEGHPEANEIVVRTAIEPDGRVRVEVSDTGPGIPPDVLPRIFAPFFTTKPAGQGTGLGLAICQQAVEGMGGVIEARSRPGEGATFTLLLPPAPVALRPAAAQAAAQAPGPRARVLVVDDEPYVGKTMRRILGASHDVEVVASAQAALERLAQPPAPDVILCDLMMPGMTGMELHAALLARDPAAASRMVFVTGGAIHESSRLFIASVANPVLEKPFATDLLRGVVAETLRLGRAALPARPEAARTP
ncbi:MAG: PAS domain S-box protein [Anaeromyxobacteraceae bacterium]|nr:PAS domain S-box protein [Anaeromyxobacteraceae bacterium]